MNDETSELRERTSGTSDQATSPGHPRAALLGAARALAEGLTALPAGAFGSKHSLRLARALALNVVDLLGAPYGDYGGST